LSNSEKNFTEVSVKLLLLKSKSIPTEIVRSVYLFFKYIESKRYSKYLKPVSVI